MLVYIQRNKQILCERPKENGRHAVHTDSICMLPVGVCSPPQHVELRGGTLRHGEHHVVHVGLLVVPPVDKQTLAHASQQNCP